MSKVINMVNVGGQWVSVQAKKKSKALAAGGTSFLASSATFAADYTTEISTASTDGTGNVTAVIAAVIAIGILGFGVSAMMGWFKR